MSASRRVGRAGGRGRPQAARGKRLGDVEARGWAAEGRERKRSSLGTWLGAACRRRCADDEGSVALPCQQTQVQPLLRKPNEICRHVGLDREARRHAEGRGPRGAEQSCGAPPDLGDDLPDLRGGECAWAWQSEGAKNGLYRRAAPTRRPPPAPADCRCQPTVDDEPPALPCALPDGVCHHHTGACD